MGKGGFKLGSIMKNGQSGESDNKIEQIKCSNLVCLEQIFKKEHVVSEHDSLIRESIQESVLISDIDKLSLIQRTYLGEFNQIIYNDPLARHPLYLAYRMERWKVFAWLMQFNQMHKFLNTFPILYPTKKESPIITECILNSLEKGNIDAFKSLKKVFPAFFQHFFTENNVNGKKIIFWILYYGNLDLLKWLDREIDLLPTMRKTIKRCQWILEDNLEAWIKNVDYPLLNQPIYDSAFTPLSLALYHSKRDISRFLVIMGAKVLPENGEALEEKKGIKSSEEVKDEFAWQAEKKEQKIFMSPKITELENIYMDVQSFLDSILFDQKKQVQATQKFAADGSAKSDIFYFLKAHVFKRILEEMNRLEMFIAPYEKMDLIILLNALLSIFAKPKTKEALEKELQQIFNDRADAIKGMFLDYCFSYASIPNQICMQIASLLDQISHPGFELAAFEERDSLSELKQDEKEVGLSSDAKKTPYSRLLYKACHAEREYPWFDPEEGPEAQALPDAKFFLRLPSDEIHLYRGIVSQAIINLKSGKKLLDHIWSGTDPKKIKPVPPLTQDVLTKLKQRTPTLKKLIEYTEELDLFTRNAKGNIGEKFYLLKDGLFAGDYRKSNNHEEAGGAAYAAIAEFAEWWNDLNKNEPQICQTIKSLGCQNGEEYQTLGQVLDVLLDIKNLSAERKDNVLYCVHLKANMIERILADKNVVDVLSKFNTAKYVTVSDKTLSEWEENITMELKEDTQRYYFTIQNNHFPEIPFWDINIILLKSQKNYNQFIAGKNIPQDLRILKDYILQEENNQNLKALRKVLQRDNYQFLRAVNESSCFPRALFSKVYTVEVKGVKRNTNKLYAALEELFADKIIKNSMRSITQPEASNKVIQQVYKDYPFIARIADKTSFMFFKENDYIHLYQNNNLSQSKKIMDNKIQQLSLMLTL